MTRTIILGDIHGCLEELLALIHRLDVRSGDRLCFVGDLVDRGPESLGVLRLVAELIRTHPGSVCVAGNHEEKSLRFHDRNKPGKAWTERATKQDWAFLDSLPLFHRIIDLADRPILLLHGGLFPAFREKHGDLGAPSPTWRRDKGKRANRLQRTLRTRKVNPAGNMVGLYDEQPDDHHWTTLYEGHEGFVFFGHDPQLKPCEPMRTEHAMGLDTGCCFGGSLTAAILETGADPAAAAIASVQGKAYSEPLLRRDE